MATTAEQVSGAVHLDPAQLEELADRLIDAIADRVVEAIRAERAGASRPGDEASARWLDAQQVAEQLGFKRDWVYQHANELGVSRRGSGSRPRLRFPPDIGGSCGKPTAEQSEPVKRQSKPSGLLPIHGE